MPLYLCRTHRLPTLKKKKRIFCSLGQFYPWSNFYTRLNLLKHCITLKRSLRVHCFRGHFTGGLMGWSPAFFNIFSNEGNSCSDLTISAAVIWPHGNLTRLFWVGNLTISYTFYMSRIINIYNTFTNSPKSLLFIELKPNDATFSFLRQGSILLSQNNTVPWIPYLAILSHQISNWKVSGT